MILSLYFLNELKNYQPESNSLENQYFFEYLYINFIKYYQRTKKSKDKISKSKSKSKKKSKKNQKNSPEKTIQNSIDKSPDYIEFLKIQNLNRYRKNYP